MALDGNSYINLQNYEISDTPDGYIQCDADIADVIATLNKKGYETFASCAGHNKIEFSGPNEFKLSDLEKIKNSSKYIISKVTDNCVYARTESASTYIYISFAKVYEFESIPEGFIYKKRVLNNSLRSIIGKMIYYYDGDVYYDDNLVRRTDEDIDKEIIESRDTLTKWVNNLKNIKER